MRQTTPSSIRRITMLAAFAALMLGTSASSAAVYRTIWDPLFNPETYTATLGWAGYGDVSISDQCLPQFEGVYDVATLDCGPVTLTSYKLDFIDVYPGGEVVSSSVADLDVPLNISTIRVNDSGGLNGIDLDGAIDAGLFELPNEGATVRAFLDFVIFQEVGLGIDPLLYAGPTLRLQICVEGQNCNRFSQTSGPNAPEAEWFLIPEPASLALVGAALAILGLGRRRKS